LPIVICQNLSKIGPEESLGKQMKKKDLFVRQSVEIFED